MVAMSCSTNTPRVTRPARVSNSRLSYRILTMMTVLLIAAATREVERLQMGLRRAAPGRTPASQCRTQPRICAPAVSVMTRPALIMFFRSISSPIMNSSSDRPISEMVWMYPGVGDPLEAVRADGEPGDEIGEQQRLARHLRHHRHDPRGDDANGDVGDEAVLHAGKLS